MSPQLSQEVMLDEVSDAVLVDMLWETQMYLYEKREVLQSLAKVLMDNWKHKKIMRKGYEDGAIRAERNVKAKWRKGEQRRVFWVESKTRVIGWRTKISETCVRIETMMSVAVCSFSKTNPLSRCDHSDFHIYTQMSVHDSKCIKHGRDWNLTGKQLTGCRLLEDKLCSILWPYHWPYQV